MNEIIAKDNNLNLLNTGSSTKCVICILKKQVIHLTKLLIFFKLTHFTTKKNIEKQHRIMPLNH